jgi:hypothetical protein
MELNNETPRLGGGVGVVVGGVSAVGRVPDPVPAPGLAAFAASLKAALSLRAAASRVFLALAGRSAVVLVSAGFVLCGVVSISSSLFIPPTEGGPVECTCTMEYLTSFLLFAVF